MHFPDFLNRLRGYFYTPPHDFKTKWLTLALGYTAVFFFLVPALPSAQSGQSSPGEVEVKFQQEDSSKQSTFRTDSSGSTIVAGISELFSDSPTLVVPLGEVILLVLFVNVFALFKKARLIMAVSYLFCLKWVFWSNYTTLLKHSEAVATTSSYIFVGCGVLTAVLFCFDRFDMKER